MITLTLEELHMTVLLTLLAMWLWNGCDRSIPKYVKKEWLYFSQLAAMTLILEFLTVMMALSQIRG